MSLLGRTPLVSAYVCPRGAFVIECKRTRAGLEIGRKLEVPSALESAFEAADHLVRVLQSAGIQKGDVVVAIRGFGAVHHVLQMPPAKDDVLGPIIEREIRRLEPQLGDGAINWTPLPAFDAAGDAPQQRSLLAAAAPRDTVQAFETRLRTAGFRLLHLTALPAAMQRLLEEFESGNAPTAIVAALPDGGFLGFAMNGGIRLIIEPPLPQNVEHEPAALAEEIELGVMFVRQQFHGAEIERVALVGTKDSPVAEESVLTERLHVPVTHLGIRDLSPAAFAALGGVLDHQSARPLSLGGTSRERTPGRARSPLEQVSIAALFVLALLGTWTVIETARMKRTTDALQTARLRVEQDSFGLAPIRATADRRKLVRNALGAMRMVVADRVALQEALAGIAAAVRPPVRLDSLNLSRGETGWRAVMIGRVDGVTNARAVQSLHDMYRELPQRLAMDSLHLDQLAYTDSAAVSGTIVRFQLSFEISTARKD